MTRVLDTLKHAIEDSDESPAAIARAAGIARSQLSRLLSGERGLSLDCAERLADALGLEVIARPKPRTRRRK
ncbi:MAG: helix-turn-helix domain-containing protein [Planctomycetota bacterium]